jgi:hypothetical protein
VVVGGFDFGMWVGTLLEGGFNWEIRCLNRRIGTKKVMKHI